MERSVKRLKIETQLTDSSESASLDVFQFNFGLCIFCQVGTNENLCNPQNNNSSTCGYKLFFERLCEFNSNGVLPSKYRNLLKLNIDILQDNSGLWHKSCRKNICKYYLPQPIDEPLDPPLASLSESLRSSLNINYDDGCFLCGKVEGILRMVKSLNLQMKVGTAAKATNDKPLLSRLALGGDLVSTRSKYHLNCLVKLYNQDKKISSSLETKNSNSSKYKSLAFFDLINFINNDSKNFSMALQDIHKLYLDRLEYLGYLKEDVNKNTTVFKEKLYSQKYQHSHKLKAEEILYYLIQPP